MLKALQANDAFPGPDPKDPTTQLPMYLRLEHNSTFTHYGKARRMEVDRPAHNHRESRSNRNHKGGNVPYNAVTWHGSSRRLGHDKQSWARTESPTRKAMAHHLLMTGPQAVLDSLAAMLARRWTASGLEERWERRARHLVLLEHENRRLELGEAKQLGGPWLSHEALHAA